MRVRFFTPLRSVQNDMIMATHDIRTRITQPTMPFRIRAPLSFRAERGISGADR